MREWQYRRDEVAASVVASLHFLKQRSAEWAHVLAGLLALTGETPLGSRASGWDYLGTWFHPHLATWVHDLRYREEGSPAQVCLRIPVSSSHRPPFSADELVCIEARRTRRTPKRGELCAEIVVSLAPGHAFAVVPPLCVAPTVWSCIRETLFRPLAEAVVLH